MSPHCIDIGIVVVRRRLRSDWADHFWLVRTVLPAVPATPPGTILQADGNEVCSFAGGASLMLHAALTAHYRDNLTARQPAIWVQLCADAAGCRVRAATADPYEGEAMGEGFGNIAEAVAMPRDVQARVWDFVYTFHIERPFIKRRRERSSSRRVGEPS